MMQRPLLKFTRVTALDLNAMKVCIVGGHFTLVPCTSASIAGCSFIHRNGLEDFGPLPKW
jgi:hypothetical protein